MSDSSTADLSTFTHDQSRLAAIVNSSDDAIISKTLTGMITTWNPGATKIFGYSEQEAIGQSMMMLIPADRADEETEILRRIASGESVRHFETIRVCKSGRMIDVSTTISPIFDQAGVIIGASKIARDITEQKRLQRQFRQNQADFRGIIEQAAVGVAHVTLDGRFKLVNQRYADILGRTLEQMQTCTFQEVTHPDDLGSDLELSRRLLAGEISTYSLEKRYLFPNGAPTWVNLTASLVVDSLGTPQYFVAVVEDINERKQIERRLRESEELFRTMANSIPQLAWFADADGHVDWYNDRWFEYTGTTPEQMKGWGWQSVHDPDRLPHVLEKWTDAIATGNGLDMEFPIRGADGVYRTFLTRVEPVYDDEGKVARWFGTNTDVESLKQHEEKIRLLNVQLEQRVAARTSQLEAANAELRQSRADITRIFESLPGLYLILTPDFTIVSASDAYLDASMTKREEILGRNIFEVFPDNPEYVNATGEKQLRASLNRVKKNAVTDTMPIQKYDVRRPDGTFEERYWSPVNSPVFGGEDTIKYIVHRVEEVTEFMQHKLRATDYGGDLTARVQQMEAEVFRSSQRTQATNEQLEAANRELEAFTYSVSHDLRAPLRGIDGYVKMLSEDFADRLDSEGNRMLGVVSSEARRMGRLIDDLLAFSRLGRQSLTKTPVDMSALAQEEFEKAAATVALGPQLELQPLPEAQGDAGMLRQVFANLIRNAVKFSSRQATSRIQIGFRQLDGWYEYYVTDNGVGFDEKYSHKLFTVFQRLHSEEEFEGTGVGLALVQRIIVRHGGRVWAEGKPGEGATFTFSLPIYSQIV
jgi:PAS domain S-box-containing protein